jgi:hypothetical protein
MLHVCLSFRLAPIVALRPDLSWTASEARSSPQAAARFSAVERSPQILLHEYLEAVKANTRRCVLRLSERWGTSIIIDVVIIDQRPAEPFKPAHPPKAMKKSWGCEFRHRHRRHPVDRTVELAVPDNWPRA